MIEKSSLLARIGYMDINSIGRMMTEKTRVNTLEQVNVALFKNNKAQAEQQVSQLMESIEPIPVGNKGHTINTQV